ncbi:hypothetical protein O0544_14715 [Edwardsiella anguillarum]|nr:hypothetical protein [Edwardsiella anguillarum]
MRRVGMPLFAVLGGASVGFMTAFSAPAPARFMRWAMSCCWGCRFPGDGACQGAQLYL